MKERMLALCYRAPYPLKSGSEIRMYQFIEMLSVYFAIDLLYVGGPLEGDCTALTEKCASVRNFPVVRVDRLVRSAASYLFHREPMQAGYFYSPKMEQYIREHIEEYSHILCMHIRTAGYLFRIPENLLAGKRLYFDGIDAISLNYQNAIQTSSGVRRLLYRMEYKRMRKYEKKAYEKFEHSILISERDRDYVVSELKAECDPVVIPNYAIDYGYLPDASRRECVLAFMGKMNYKPNVDAVTHFAKAVYGRLKERFPELQFWIIGGNAAKEVQRMGEMDGVRLCGFVENPSQLLSEATIVIAPMISGSGLQNKIVQAMCLGCAVVTTPIGADGLKNLTGEELAIAETDDKMLDILSHLLRADGMGELEKMGQRAGNYILENYSYDAVSAQMCEAFDVTERRGGVAGEAAN